MSPSISGKKGGEGGRAVGTDFTLKREGGSKKGSALEGKAYIEVTGRRRSQATTGQSTVFGGGVYRICLLSWEEELVTCRGDGPRGEKNGRYQKDQKDLPSFPVEAGGRGLPGGEDNREQMLKKPYGGARGRSGLPSGEGGAIRLRAGESTNGKGGPWYWE